MKLKVEETQISGYDKDNVLNSARNYCLIHPGYNFRSGVYKDSFSFKYWKWKYSIILYKPLNFKFIMEDNGK